MEINLNDKIWVKLNDHGRELLVKDHEQFWKDYPSASVSIPAYQPPEQDAQGWSSFQLWELFELFGKHIKKEMPIPFATAIRLDKPNLYRLSQIDDSNPRVIIVQSTSREESVSMAQEYENNEYLGECDWINGAVCIQLDDKPKVILRR